MEGLSNRLITARWKREKKVSEWQEERERMNSKEIKWKSKESEAGRLAEQYRERKSHFNSQANV